MRLQGHPDFCNSLKDQELRKLFLELFINAEVREAHCIVFFSHKLSARIVDRLNAMYGIVTDMADAGAYAYDELNDGNAETDEDTRYPELRDAIKTAKLLIHGQMHRCDNCGTTMPDSGLAELYPNIEGLLKRMEPGGTVPSGTCGGCGALVYLCGSEGA